jgi:hypothetical protein
MTKDAMKLALEALEYIDLCDNDRDFLHPHECFQLDEAITAIKQALAAPVQEQKYTTTRNSWTGKATHKCNLCGKDDFRSEYAAKFHECQKSVPDAITGDDESPEYRTGWNECRETMLNQLTTQPAGEKK